LVNQRNQTYTDKCNNYSFIFLFSVKPALFDLFLAIGIGSYLGLVYLFFEVSDPFKV